MAIALVGTSSGSVPEDDPDPFALDMPPGTTAGMVMVAFVSSFNTPIAFPGDGWEPFELVEGNPSEPPPEESEFDPRIFKLRGWTKVVDPGDTGPWEFVAASHAAAGGIATFSGVDPVEPVGASDTAQETTYTTTIVLPSITAPRPGCVLLGSVGCSWAPASWSPPGSMTEMWERIEAEGDSSNMVNEAAYESLGSAGATGTRTFTASDAVFSAGIVCVLQPPPARWHVGFVGSRS